MFRDQFSDILSLLCFEATFMTSSPSHLRANNPLHHLFLRPLSSILSLVFPCWWTLHITFVLRPLFQHHVPHLQGSNSSYHLCVHATFLTLCPSYLRTNTPPPPTPAFPLLLHNRPPFSWLLEWFSTKIFFQGFYCVSQTSVHLYSPSRSLRCSSDTCMLKIQRFSRKTHGFCTFSHFGPHIRNNLPQDTRHCATLSSLKSQLKTFLFSEYFS